MAKTNDVLDDLFAGIEDSTTPTSSTPSHSTPATSNPSTQSKSEKDILAELDLLTAERPATSRPATPRGTLRKSLESRRPNLASSDLPTRRSGEGYGINTSLSRRDSSDVIHTPTNSTPPTFAVTSPAGISTPPPPRRSTPHLQQTQTPPPTTGGGWWGSIFTTATTAINTAQHTVTDRLSDLQNSDEAKKWTTQGLHLLGTAQSELRSRALPTLSTLLHTIAPPIASHEQLRIHITHDIHNYPSIDTIVYGVFERVMQQVEGGDLLVVQKGKEAKPRSNLLGGVGGGSSGWADGPWYKSPEPRALNALESQGVEEGVKLARAAAVAYAQEYVTAHPGDEAAPNPNNPTRKSDIFLAIQPTNHPVPAYLRETGAQEDDETESPEESPTSTTFALHLHDPHHNISYSTLSQSIPAKWLEWIDSPAHTLHGDISAIVEEGGVDPREWVVEWVEETLGLAVGVVAQRYVAKRMNVGGAGLELEKGKGRQREREVVSGSGGGEVARAVGM